MGALKSLTFTALPKIGANHTGSSDEYDCALRGAKMSAERSQLRSDGADLGEEERIEFEKGKDAIAVPSFEKIPMVIDILINAVRNGELDAQLAQAKKPLTAVKSPKAA
jgi:hypothetical protein